MVTFGADPEFEASFFGDIKRADLFPLKYSVPRVGRVGYDGSMKIGEVRPRPSESIEELVRRTGRLYMSVFNRGIAPYLHSLVFPCGGHIHIGGRDPYTTLRLRQSRAIPQFLGRLIGEYLVRFDGPARAQSHYSSPYAFRLQPHGIEYRAPGAWIYASPGLALAVLRSVERVVRALLLGATPPSGPELTDPISEEIERLGKNFAFRLSEWGAYLAYRPHKAVHGQGLPVPQAARDAFAKAKRKHDITVFVVTVHPDGELGTNIPDFYAETLTAQYGPARVVDGIGLVHATLGMVQALAEDRKLKEGFIEAIGHMPRYKFAVEV